MRSHVNNKTPTLSGWFPQSDVTTLRFFYAKIVKRVGTGRGSTSQIGQRCWLGTTCCCISSRSQLQFRDATYLSKTNFSVSRFDFSDCAVTSGAYWNKQRIVFPSALGKKV